MLTAGCYHTDKLWLAFSSLITAEKNKTIRVLNNETCQLMTAAGYLQRWWAESNRWLEAESLCSEWLYSNSQVGTCLQRHLLTWTKTSCRGLKVIVQAQLKILNWLWSKKPFGPFQCFSGFVRAQMADYHKCGDQENCDGKFATAFKHYQCSRLIDCNSCEQLLLPPIRSAVWSP